MNVIQTILQLAVLLLPVLMVNCSNSALSDIRLTDPSLVCLQAEMRLITSADGSASQSIRVVLEDKNNRHIELKEGKVLVDNVELDVEHALGEPYYTTTTGRIQIKVDSMYTFTVVLADSQEYTSTIRTQKNNLHFINLPTSHNKTDSLRVAFGIVDPESKQTTVSLTKTLKGDSLRDDFSHFSFDSRTITIADTGYIFLPPSYFEPNLNRIDIAFETEKPGMPNVSFRNGSYVKSILEIHGTVETVPWKSIVRR